MGRARSADAGRRGPVGRRLRQVTGLYHCCRPAFDTIRTGGPTRSSADVSVPRLAGFSLITLITRRIQLKPEFR